ncbi:hypothetical protein [Pseudomonas sp. KNUC1026]|uniref:hypothetical protein n=1 Tax=Pseudomonas sp. KNUC1026 TaxID=2893890 RepID=UPI001F3E4D6B|nr:hypothetical protein [Pseudomonas sp. KNUC1026]UFH48011.1 hypothetical protein LN139_12255 [Pseudomonas sp. KNUC1026]
MPEPTLVDELVRCAGLFRLAREIEAALLMVDLLDRAAPLLAGAPPVVAEQWPFVLSAIFSHQQAQDWLAVADDLQYELVEIFRAFS